MAASLRSIVIFEILVADVPYIGSDIAGLGFDGNQGAMQEPFVIPKRVPRGHEGVFFSAIPAEDFHLHFGMECFPDFIFRSAGGFHCTVPIRVLHGLIHEFLYFAGRDVVRERCIPFSSYIFAEVGLQCSSNPFGYGIFGVFLHPGIEGGVDFESVPVEVVWLPVRFFMGLAPFVHPLPYVFPEIGSRSFGVVLAYKAAHVDRQGAEGIVLGLIDIIVFEHLPQHDIASLSRILRIPNRIVIGGCFEHAN